MEEPAARFEHLLPLAVYVAALVMLVAGITGAPRVFAAALVGMFATFVLHAFAAVPGAARWAWPTAIIGVLALGVAAAFAFADVPVRSVKDTVLGVQPGTAALVYLVWLPAFVTLGGGFYWWIGRLDREEGS